MNDLKHANHRLIGTSVEIVDVQNDPADSRILWNLALSRLCVSIPDVVRANHQSGKFLEIIADSGKESEKPAILVGRGAVGEKLLEQQSIRNTCKLFLYAVALGLGLGLLNRKLRSPFTEFRQLPAQRCQRAMACCQLLLLTPYLGQTLIQFFLCL